MTSYYIVKVDDLYTDTVYYIKDMLSELGIEFEPAKNYTDDIIINLGGVDFILRNDLYASGDDVVLITRTEILLMKKSYIDDINRTIKCIEFDSFKSLFRWFKLKALLRK